MRRHSERRSRGGSKQPAPVLVQLRDFTYYGPQGEAVARVQASELLQLLASLAECHGWDLEDLLLNSEVPTGKMLPCRRVKTLPDGCSWISSRSKYIRVKFRESPVVAGRSFARVCTDDAEWHGGRNAGGKRKVAGMSSHTPPPRVRRAQNAAPATSNIYSLTPESPGHDLEGSTCPLPLLLHRAAYFSACPDSSAAVPTVVRHICGHDTCAVVSHYRAGTPDSNESDRQHHTHSRGTSREPFPRLQPMPPDDTNP